MQLDILSQNLVIYACVILTGATSFVLFKIYGVNDPKKKKKKKKVISKLEYLQYDSVQLGLGVITSFVIAFLIDQFVSNFTDSVLPRSFILMCLPFTLLVCLTILAFIKKKLRLVSVITMVFALVFSIILINDYYRYYAVLGEVFGQNDAIAFNASLNNVTVNYTVSEHQDSYNAASLQAAIEKIPAAPTTGKIYKINIPGTISKFKARPGFVYVPAIYNNLTQARLPVLVLTSGVPGAPDNWLDLGLEPIMNQFASTHDGIAPLVFVADSIGSLNNDTECVNSPRGNAETYLSVDVPNYIKKNFRVDTSPKNWAIGGLSLGGMCSVMLTLRHPNVYNYFIDLGGEAGPEVGSEEATIDTLFGGSEQAWAAHQPTMLLANNNYPELGGFFGDGNQDSRNVTTAISELSAESKKAGLDTVTETVNGAHTFNVWAETFKDSLPWISNRIGATRCNASSCI